MFEKEAEEYLEELRQKKIPFDIYEVNNQLKLAFIARLNKANEWFDAKTSIPLPKKAEIYRYTLEVISNKGDIVCYDYKDKDWKKLVIEDEKVTYVPVEIEKWCNKPTKENE